MTEIINLSSDNTLFRGKLKGALVFIKNSLLEVRKTSLVIKKSKFKSMLDGVKFSLRDEMVENALDDVFKEYFKDNIKESGENSAIKMNDYVEVGKIEDSINNKMDALDNSSSNQIGGPALVKTLNAFKDTSNAEDNKASNY